AIAIDPATTRIVRTIEGAIANIVDKRTEGIYGFKLDREDAELIALARLAEELAVKVGITLDPIRHDELHYHDQNSLALGYAKSEDLDYLLAVNRKNGRETPAYTEGTPEYELRPQAGRHYELMYNLLHKARA